LTRLGDDDGERDGEKNLDGRRPPPPMYQANQQGERDPDAGARGDVAEARHDDVDARRVVETKQLEGREIEPSNRLDDA
jgi:hypothetical protein